MRTMQYSTVSLLACPSALQGEYCTVLRVTFEKNPLQEEDTDYATEKLQAADELRQWSEAAQCSSIACLVGGQLPHVLQLCMPYNMGARCRDWEPPPHCHDRAARGARSGSSEAVRGA